jgi:hypothetical protein
MLTIPKLQIPNTLPRPRIQPPIRNRNGHARTHQRTLHMCRHIIRALCIMSIQALLATGILRDYAVERVGHVGAYIGVVVFVQGEGAGCVLNEEV